MAKKSKMMNYVMKGIIAVVAVMASLLLLAPLYQNSYAGNHLFDCWDNYDSLSKLFGTSFNMMTVLFSIVFFLGILIALSYVANMFLRNKTFASVLRIASLVLAVLAVVGLICAFALCGTDAGKAVKLGVGAGAIISTICSVATCALAFAEKALAK